MMESADLDEKSTDQVLTRCEAVEVYGLLVEFCGAPTSGESGFVSRNTSNRCAEFLCLPKLGFRGAFWRLDRYMVVICAGSEAEDVLALAKSVNEILEVLMDISRKGVES